MRIQKRSTYLSRRMRQFHILLALQDMGTVIIQIFMAQRMGTVVIHILAQQIVLEQLYAQGAGTRQEELAEQPVLGLETSDTTEGMEVLGDPMVVVVAEEEELADHTVPVWRAELELRQIKM